MKGAMFTGLSHVSIVVPDLDAAVRRLRETYGLTIGDIRTNAEQGVHLAYVELPNARIELMAPSRPDSPVAKFLERNPKGGIHHLSLSVEGMDAAAGALREQGVRILGDGELTKKLTIRAHHFSKSAAEKVAARGGTTEVIPPPKKPVRNKMRPRPPKQQ